MLRQAVLLFSVAFIINHVQCLRIIGNLETPKSGLLKNFEKGGGEQFEVAKHLAKGEEGDKGYVSQHAEEQGAKGSHDKEDHQKHYAESGMLLFKSQTITHSVKIKDRCINKHSLFYHNFNFSWQ